MLHHCALPVSLQVFVTVPSWDPFYKAFRARTGEGPSEMGQDQAVLGREKAGLTSLPTEPQDTRSALWRCCPYTLFPTVGRRAQTLGLSLSVLLSANLHVRDSLAAQHSAVLRTDPAEVHSSDWVPVCSECSCVSTHV